MIEVMRETGILMTEEKIRRGMKKAVQKARFEIVEKSPYVILDGAHNPAGRKSADRDSSHAFFREEDSSVRRDFKG